MTLPPMLLGATRIVPGSNLLDYPRPEDTEAWMRQSVPGALFFHLFALSSLCLCTTSGLKWVPLCAALMPRGSILFFEGQCSHRRLSH